jgi:YegS/Rv2252/BmrU family lipid kinase
MITTKDIIFIINPNSGKRKIAGIIKQIEDYKDKLDFFITNSYEDFEFFLNENISKYKVIVIVGGDGTINSAVNYLYDFPNKIMAIIPTGSGNGFARELGFDGDFKSLINDILQNETYYIDVLEVNNKKFINIFGLGFDSHVAHVFDKRKKRGLWNYIISVFISISQFKPVEATISLTNKFIEGKFNMIVVANASQFGNNAHIAPFAKPNNDFYELALIKPFPFYCYPIFVFRMMTKKLKNSKYIQYIKLKEEIIIKANTNKCHIDGEPINLKGEINVKILEKKIKVVKTKKTTI